MQPVLTTISIATSEGRYFFTTDEIVRLEARSNYTNIYFTNRKKICTAKILKGFDQMLEPFGFLRTHRRHLVNRRHIRHIAPNGNIIMKDASEAEISRRMKSAVMKRLKNA